MLQYIRFNDKQFSTYDENNAFVGLTMNTVVICSRQDLMDGLAKDIVDTVNGAAVHNEYGCANGDKGKAEIILASALQKVIAINYQKITLSVEPAVVYKARTLDDIWFFDDRKADEKECRPYEKFIYPLSAFKASGKIWREGIEAVYACVCNGNFGTMAGLWLGMDGTKASNLPNIRCHYKYGDMEIS